jgi:deoxyuridine 5'-triphosphate nucleotidohydrolase
MLVIPTDNLCVKLLSEKATVPTRGSKDAAGLDLYSAVYEIIPPNERKLISLDIAIRLPKNSYGQIASRSGLASKFSIDVGAGVIDEDYTGCISVLLINHSKHDFEIKIGDRIAQLLILPILKPNISKVETLPTTQRGNQGFGSTGV